MIEPEHHLSAGSGREQAGRHDAGWDDAGRDGAGHPHAGHDVVEMTVPSDGAFVAVLRTVAAGLASRCDLTLDEIEDLRIAVDEACSLLLPHAAVGSRLDARFTLAPGELGIAASIQATDDAEPDRDGFAWTVLDALAHSVDVTSEQGRLAITLTKRREDRAGEDLPQ